MDAEKRIVIFDTSAINALRDDHNQDSIVERLGMAFHVRISGSNLVEVSGTSDSESRRRLLDLCERLLYFGECIMPYDRIITEMARCNTRHKERFEWRDVDVRAPMIEEEIVERRLVMDDAIAEEVRLDSRGKNREFLDVFRDAREKFENAFDGEQMPSITELIRMDKADGGTFWRHAASQYERANLFAISDPEIRSFTNRCPPFHALTLVPCVAQFQYGLPVRKEKALYKAGRLDLFMATYLPYCDLFVTREKEGQLNALRVITTEVGLSTRVMSYSEFVQEVLTRM
jgi:hypothetical protein